jgi:hypothetical protein
MSGGHVPHIHFNFKNAKRTLEAIKGLNNTKAFGVDGIPTSVLKKDLVILAGPVSHLVNRSLAEGKVPAQFKIGRVHLIYKGKGKPLGRPWVVSPSLDTAGHEQGAGVAREGGPGGTFQEGDRAPR